MRFKCEKLSNENNEFSGFLEYGKYLAVYIVIATIVYTIIRRKIP